MKNLTPLQKERRERILSSTREQLSRLGYERLNMRDLAVAADVSTSTLYNLYQGKDTLILVALQDLLAELNQQVAEQQLQGIDRVLARTRGVADQIVATPEYAEAMGKMLFNAEPSDPIVQTLIGGAMAGHVEEICEMLDGGELRADADRDFLARLLASEGWSVILMWMKGYIALHDFKAEYERSVVTTLMPWVTPVAETRLRQLL